MADSIEKKELSLLIKESWDFFTKRWVILFQISLFVWIPVMLILPLAVFLLSSYNSLKTKPELLFSIKVLLAGGILSFTILGIFILILLMDKLMKVTLIDKLWEKPEEKYYLEFLKLIKEVWPKMGAFFNTQLKVWFIVLSGCLLLFVPGMLFLANWMSSEEAGYLCLPLFTPGILFLIWFSFVPYELILRGKTGKDALSSSKKIIRHSLLEFIGNMLVLIGILIFINIGLTGFFKLIFAKSTALANFGEFAATIISNILSLWLTVFHFSLYKELEKRYLIGPGASAPHPEERRDEGSLQV